MRPIYDGTDSRSKKPANSSLPGPITWKSSIQSIRKRRIASYASDQFKGEWFSWSEPDEDCVRIISARKATKNEASLFTAYATGLRR